MGLLEKVGMRRRTPLPHEKHVRGREIVSKERGVELLHFLAWELRYRVPDPTAYVRVVPPIEEPHHYEVELRWDVRRTAPGRYAFSNSESRKVTMMGGCEILGASRGLDVYYYLPRKGDPNQDNPINVDTDLLNQGDNLPKPLAEYSLEDKVRYAMSKTSHRMDMHAGTFNTELWSKVSRMV